MVALLPPRSDMDSYFTTEPEIVSSPAYSPLAADSERVLQAASSPQAGPSSQADLTADSREPNPCSHFIYACKNPLINLGPRFWGFPRPAYGFNGVVEGTVKFLEGKSTYAFRMTATLLGTVKVTTSQRGMLADSVDLAVVNKTIVFPPPPEGGFYLPGHTSDFSIPFPTYCQGGTTVLPPSYASWSPGVSTEVSYVLKVDVFRKGLRRHTQRTVPLFYFPKTWPPRPPFRGDITNAAYVASGVLTNVHLNTRWPCGLRATSNPNAPSVNITFPSDPVFSSGFHMLLKLCVCSPQAPALTELLLRRAEIRLIKRSRAWVKGNNLCTSRRSVVSSATFVDTHSREGSSEEIYELLMGQPGAEQSWHVSETIEMAYAIEIIVQPPETASNFIPAFHYQKPVQIASEPWGTRESEMLQLGGHSAPALGLSNVQRELRPCQSVNW